MSRAAARSASFRHPGPRPDRSRANKVRGRLNPAAAHDAGLTSSAPLLRGIGIVPAEEE